MKPTHSKIHDLPNIDKPREKLIRYGVEKLSNSELLGIVLRTGTKGKNVITLSKSIFEQFGDDVKNVGIDQLKEVPGIGNAKACEIMSIFELGKRFYAKQTRKSISTAEDVWFEAADLRKEKKEHFVCFNLDSRSKLISKEVISVGTLTTSLVHPREVFEPAIKCAAAFVILCHNHPSGSVNPSEADIGVTKRIKTAGEILGIHLIDHIIVTPQEWYSMRENQLL